MKLLSIIKRWLCRHDWKLSKFQALGAGTIHGYSYRCTKCGRMQYND